MEARRFTAPFPLLLALTEATAVPDRTLGMGCRTATGGCACDG